MEIKLIGNSTMMKTITLNPGYLNYLKKRIKGETN
jgi:hypothetical protein